MTKIQSLGMISRTKEEIHILHEDIEIFDKLAMINSRDKSGNKLIDNSKRMYRWLNKILIDLGLDFDKNISITFNVYECYHLDLSLTNYNDEEKSNIYYIFYGIPVFRPYYNKSVYVAGDSLSRSYKFNGIGSYWIASPGSFFNDILTSVEIEDQIPFADSFHFLSMYYLSCNGYQNYKDALQNGFNHKK